MRYQLQFLGDVLHLSVLLDTSILDSRSFIGPSALRPDSKYSFCLPAKKRKIPLKGNLPPTGKPKPPRSVTFPSAREMKVPALLLLAYFSGFVLSQSSGLGDGLWRTFGTDERMPLTSQAAEAQGWKRMSPACDAQQGFRFAQGSAQPGTKTPLTLYYTASGQIAGAGVDIFGEGAAPENLVAGGFWVPVPGALNQWTISVSFRSSSAMCSRGSWPPNINGTINSFFFTTPLGQPGSNHVKNSPGV